MQTIGYLGDSKAETQPGGSEVPRGQQEATLTSRLETKGRGGGVTGAQGQSPEL